MECINECFCECVTLLEGWGGCFPKRSLRLPVAFLLFQPCEAIQVFKLFFKK